MEMRILNLLNATERKMCPVEIVLDPSKTTILRALSPKYPL